MRKMIYAKIKTIKYAFTLMNGCSRLLKSKKQIKINNQYL